MSGKFPARGDFSLPTALLDEYVWLADSLIDGPTGVNCTLIYPPYDDECPNCSIDPTTGRSLNIYRAGGPVSFPNHTICPWCFGEGRKLERPTESVRLRVYTKPRDWVNTGLLNQSILEHPDGTVQVIGYMVDLPKLQKSVEIILYSNLEAVKQWKCKCSGGPSPFGLAPTRYFAQFLKIV